MADFADKGQAVEEFYRDLALKNTTREGPRWTGYCLWCEEPMEYTGQRWCNVECRDDWERAHDRK